MATLFEDDSGIKQRMEAAYERNASYNIARWSEADLDTRFCAGEQELWTSLYGNLPGVTRRQFYFNRILRVRNMITGYQRRNRKSITTVPVENSDNETADLFTASMFHIETDGNVGETVSQAFDVGAVVTGQALMSAWVDYRHDPINGDIKTECIPSRDYAIDPYWSKTDLSDCNWIWRRRWLSKIQALSLFPEYREQIEEMSGRGNGDGKFEYQPQNYDWSPSDLLYLDEFWYRDFRDQTIAIDLQSGETMEIEEDNEKYDEFIAMQPNVVKQKRTIPTVKTALVLQGNVLYDGPNLYKLDRFPFVPVVGYYEPELPYTSVRCQGVARTLRDAQFLYNRRMNIMLDIFESQVNSGWIYKVNRLVNPNDVFMTGQGKGIALKEEADLGTDISKIPAPDIPPSTFQMSEMLGNEITAISGVSEELLGMSEDEIPGILSMLRQGAGLTTLQKLFDQLDNSMKELGRLIVSLIQLHYSAQKIMRITGKQPSPQFFNRQFARYDIRIEEGLNTTTQRQMQFAQLLQLRELKVPVPDDVLIQNSTLQGKEELIAAIQQERQQAEQMQQAQQQMEMAVLQSQIQAYEGQAAANQGLGLERVSRVPENRALAIERVAEARKDRMAGVLDMAKAIKELEGMSLDQIVRIIEMGKIIQEKSSQDTPRDVSMPDIGQAANEAATILNQLGMTPPQNGQPQPQPMGMQ